MSLVGLGDDRRQDGDAGQAADVHESERPVGRRRCWNDTSLTPDRLIVVYDELDLPWAGAADPAERFGRRATTA